MRKIKNMILVAHNSRVMLKSEETAIQQDRLDICATCEYNSYNRRDISLKNRIFILLNKLFNRFYGLKIATTAICTLCNCDLSVMSSVYSEKTECKLGKWK